MRKDIWRIIRRWLMYTVAGSFIPFFFIYCPWMSDKDAQRPAFTDTWKHGELVAISAVLTFAAFGDAMAARHRHADLAEIVVFLSLLLFVVESAYFGYLQIPSNIHDPRRITIFSLIFFVCATIGALSCKIMSEVKP
ncbi:MAG TPA: hypothetical protein VHY37_00480 [Tepidisphaeraceae bacterium]|jgi:hypothetical protein|nr:hypothetical protein [Tepidisphaeraceae bacterium]